MKTHPADLSHEFKRLFRTMTFVAGRSALHERGPQAQRFAEIYQQLGVLWEFLALQCRHTAGWRKLRAGKLACKLCGTLRDAPERWLLLPRDGRKTVGRKRLPNSGETFPNKRVATIVDDTIAFHGATLSVAVHNAYRSRMLRSGSGECDVSIAADRCVRVREGAMECWMDTSLAQLTLRGRKRGERPPYGAFVFELPKRVLKRFPILIEHDSRGDLVGVTVFRPVPVQSRRKTAKAAPRKRAGSRSERSGTRGA